MPPREPEPAPEWEAVLALDAAASRSVRGPNDGAIEGAVRFPLTGPGLRFNPRRSEDARYGTIAMVQSLVRAGIAVHESHPGGELTVNDLSLVEGGAIPHHGSHRAGRDVDTLFYLLDEQGEPFPSVGAPIDPEGQGTDYRDLADPEDDIEVRIDLPRTWAFISSLIRIAGEGPSPVQRIFVVEHIRTMLLRHARAVDAPRELVRRFAELTCQPSYPHDDHFHIRFYCSAADIERGCEDSRPWYPWRTRELRPLRMNRHQPRADRPTAPITTNEQARAAAGPMHPSVRAFLRRRRAWQEQPHPGRQWCR